MRRALAAVLILSMLGGQLGMFGALIGRHHARQQMRHRIAAASESPNSTAALQHLTISRSERQSTSSSFVWIEEREFRYQGNLYDLVHEEWRGGVWHVWAYHDREEEHYLEALARAMDTSMLKGAPVSPQHRPLAHAPRALTPPALVSPPSPLQRSQSFPCASLAHHQAPYLAVPHPPPWG